MKKVVRDLKRGVNKKVLKVNGIEQKIHDVTSNEPWGPQGTTLAELAQATHNNREYQLIMMVIWKRLNDTGKNWRHVFKALTVLEYLVAHGSERVIGEVREHAYQISTLADFIYVDSNGRDQGINVRKKSQILVALVNDKERIREVRQKAQANKDTYGTSLTGGAYRQSSYSDRGGYGDHHYDDDSSENRANERNGYGDDDRDGRSRNSVERYSRDAYREDSYRGHDNDDDQFRTRSQNGEGYTDQSFGKADEHPQDERGVKHDLDTHYEAASPNYEEAIRSSQDANQNERDGESVAVSTPNMSSPPAHIPTSPSISTVQGRENAESGETVAFQSDTNCTFDEFDPRGPTSGAQPAASSQELDIFEFSRSNFDPFAIVLANSTSSQSDTTTKSVFGTDFFVTPSSASAASHQPNKDPFGDAPFKAIPQENVQAQPQQFPHVSSFQPSDSVGRSETLPSALQKVDASPGFDFGDTFGGFMFAPSVFNSQPAPASSSSSTLEFAMEQSSNDILDSILPRSGSAPLLSSQETQSVAPVDAQSAQMNPFQSAGPAHPMVAHGSAPNTPTDQISPFQPSGVQTSVATQESSTNTQTAEMNPFQPFGSSAPIASQESPTNRQNLFLFSGPAASQKLTTNMQTSQLNLAPLPGPSVSASSHGSPTNMQTAQMNLPMLPGPSISASSQGSPTNMQASQANIFNPSGASAPSQEPTMHIQRAQMNFPQPSVLTPPQMNFFNAPGLSAPMGSQEPQMSLQTAQMNIFQPSGLLPQMASQGLHPNLQIDQLNFLQPSTSSSPKASQGLQTHMQVTQPNFLAHSGLPASAASQGLQVNFPTSQTSFLQPTRPSAPISSQVAQSAAAPNMQAAQFGAPTNIQTTHLQFGSQSLQTQVAQPSVLQHSGLPASAASQGSQTNTPTTQASFLLQSGLSAPVSSQVVQSAAPPNMQVVQSEAYPNMQTAHVQLGPQSLQTATPMTKPHLAKEKFETKSTVWADTLSRGLVNLDISGPKTNPLSDIGVDFDAINRREKRLEPKSSAPPAASTITMGKAMGTGSGLGRSAASGRANPPNTMRGPGMGMRGMGMGMGGGVGMGMGMGMGMRGGIGMGMGASGMGMGGYGGNMNQPPMGMNVGMNAGMGMNMGFGQGAPMHPPGPGMPNTDGGYNPMMGMGDYGSQNQQPYGGGYR